MPLGVYNSYDIVGDIAIIKVPNDNIENAKKAAAEVMTVYKKLKDSFGSRKRNSG